MAADPNSSYGRSVEQMLNMGDELVGPEVTDLIRQTIAQQCVVLSNGDPNWHVADSTPDRPADLRLRGLRAVACRTRARAIAQERVLNESLTRGVDASEEVVAQTRDRAVENLAESRAFGRRECGEYVGSAFHEL